jgi:hypothetical protein
MAPAIEEKRWFKNPIHRVSARDRRRAEAESTTLGAARTHGVLPGCGGSGKRAETLDLVAPVYSWFTEGFDTPDLVEAKALLQELA